MVHVSTDYVFDGKGCIPYTEEMPTCPQSAYGRTKLEGEHLLMEALGDDAVILRTAWLYSPYGKNFVKTMLQLGKDKPALKVVFDQVGTPTYAGNLAAVIYRIAMEMACGDFRKVDNGIYNFTDEGVCSWYDFATAITELSNSDCKVLPCHSDEFPSKVKRPSYSVLDKSKIKQRFQLEIPHWRDSLKICVEALLR